MAFDQRKLGQTVWAIALMAMGVLLCVKTPYALREAPQSWFLSFTRYFVALFLVVGGVKKLCGLYLVKPKEPSQEH